MVWKIVLGITVMEICCLLSEAQYTQYTGGLLQMPPTQCNDPYQTACCPQHCGTPCGPTMDPCGAPQPNSGPCATGSFAPTPNSYCPNLTPTPNSYCPNPATTSNSYAPNPASTPNSYCLNPATTPNSYCPNPAPSPNSYCPNPVPTPNSCCNNLAPSTNSYCPNPAPTPNSCCPNPAPTPDSYNCPCHACSACYDNSLPAINNQFSTNFGNLLYSILTDSQLNGVIPCAVIKDLDTLLVNLQTSLKEQPRYKSAQYTCMVACLQDQLAALGAEFGCDITA